MKGDALDKLVRGLSKLGQAGLHYKQYQVATSPSEIQRRHRARLKTAQGCTSCAAAAKLRKMQRKAQLKNG